MSGIGCARNTTLYLGDYNPYLRNGKYLFDPSGKNANYLYKSVSKSEMKRHLMNKYTKEEIVNMLLDFVECGDSYQEVTA